MDNKRLLFVDKKLYMLRNICCGFIKTQHKSSRKESNRMWLCMLHCWMVQSKNRRMDEAMDLLKNMKKNGVHPNMIIYNILIRGLWNVGKHEEAVNVFSFVVAKGLRQDVCLYNVMIKGLCKNGLLTDANELFEKMDGIRCSPNEFTFYIIIQALLEIKDVKRAVKLVCLMRDKGFA